jgi:hypothetical protein
MVIVGDLNNPPPIICSVMLLRDILISKKLTYDVRAVMFALKMYAENALLVGVLCSNEGKPMLIEDFVPLRYIEEALKHDIIFRNDCFYVFRHWYNFFVQELQYANVERFRKANKYTKQTFISFLQEYIGDSSKYKYIIDMYKNDLVPSCVSVIDIINQSSIDDVVKLEIQKYMMKFSSPSQLAHGIVPCSKRAISAVNEILSIAETGKMFFGGKCYNVAINVLLDGLIKINGRYNVVGLTNNNYLKKMLINKDVNSDYNKFEGY